MKQVRQKAASGLTGGGERARRRLLTPQLYHARQFCQIFPQRPTHRLAREKEVGREEAA